MARSWWSSLVLWYRGFLFVRAVPPLTSTPGPLASYGQLVRSYAAVLTFCPIGGMNSEAFPASTPVPGIQRRQSAAKYYSNFSVTASPQDECSTSYSPTLTRSCATTLTPVGAPPLPITACDQEVTFSTDHGYRPAPTSTESTDSGSDGSRAIETLTTFYLADWTDVATGLPRGLVKEKVCSEAGCMTRLERWIPVTTQTLQILTSTVQFTGVLSTPAQVLAGSVILTAFTDQGQQPSSISLSAVIEITQTVPQTEVSISTISQPAATSPTNNTYGTGNDDDDYTSTTTSTSTLTSYRTIQSASVE
ncbi:MAG: hypothetical protein Q9194_004695 [Teloschistes cf. exilis]